MRLAIAVATALSMSAGCLFSSGKPKPISAFEVRTGVAGTAWANMSKKDRKLLRRGKLRAGMPEAAAYVALGTPAFHWDTEIGERNCKVLLFATKRKNKNVTSAVYSCQGVIAHTAKVEPELPCWRVAQVAPRILEKYKYFRKQPLGKQWELVAGILKRGHSNRDVYVAFGKPYNSGFEEREDGTRASKQVFLDHGRESYGLYITLIDRKVAGWRVPADRRLTPEAQKRRLEAMEKRLTDKLREMEEAAERRHAETVEYFNEVLANQEDMKDMLVRIDSKVDDVLSNQDVMIANQGQMLDNQGQMLDNQADLKRGQRVNRRAIERTGSQKRSADDARRPKSKANASQSKRAQQSKVRSRGVPAQDQTKSTRLRPGDDGYAGSDQEFLDNDPKTQMNAAYDNADRQCKLASEKVNDCRRNCPRTEELQTQCTATYRTERRKCEGEGKRKCIKKLRAERKECARNARKGAKSCLSTCGDPATICKPIFDKAKKDARKWERKMKKRKKRR